MKATEAEQILHVIHASMDRWAEKAKNHKEVRTTFDHMTTAAGLIWEEVRDYMRDYLIESDEEVQS